MEENRSLHKNMRVYHRYLGFFLAGIMAMYAISGVILIFRDTEFLQAERPRQMELAPQLSAKEVGKAIGIKDLTPTQDNATELQFAKGRYNKVTGEANYTVKALPFVLDKMTHLHKAKSSQPLFYFNIFFGASLLFFVLSSFWMFLPKTTMFKKGLYFTLAGLVLTLLLLFL
jgi:hypothetical protein